MARWVEVWTTLVPDERGGPGSLKANIPAEVPYRAEGGMVRDMATGDGGGFAVAHVNVWIPEQDKERCAGRLVSADNISDRDKLLVAMVRQCRDDYAHKIESFVANNTHVGTTTDRKRVLAEAVGRGVSVDTAESLRTTQGLPTDPATTGSIDAPLLEAKYRYGKRVYGDEITRAEIDADISKGRLTEAHAATIRTRLDLANAVAMER